MSPLQRLRLFQCATWKGHNAGSIGKYVWCNEEQHFNTHTGALYGTLFFTCRRFGCIVGSWMHTWILCSNFDVYLSSAVWESAPWLMEISIGVVFMPQRILRDIIWHWTPHFYIRKQRKFHSFLYQKTAEVSLISVSENSGNFTHFYIRKQRKFHSFLYQKTAEVSLIPISENNGSFTHFFCRQIWRLVLTFILEFFSCFSVCLSLTCVYDTMNLYKIQNA
jgi:hypothetical protein